ncbi:hypothetical protein DFJ73DRAFT_815577 [Zopfochytrium polystomum]|nr:hypothetical protein DFJ73DRAFT_815577 [Zopfochytrium polystomum]
MKKNNTSMLKGGGGGNGILGVFAKAPSGPIAENIENATNEQQQTDIDWSYVIAATQLINNDAAKGVPIAIKSLKLKLKSKSPVVINYALTVMDAFVKGCGRPFANELCQKDSLNFLHSTLERKSLAPENRGRLLELIADWSILIREPPSMLQFFHKLVSEGFRFPPTENVRQLLAAGGAAPPPQELIFATSEPTSGTLTTDISLAENTSQMFLETLNFSENPDELPSNEIVQEFKAKCEELRSRLATYIQQPSTDEAQLAKLLQAHTSIVNALDQYETLIKSQSAQAAEGEQAEPSAQPPEVTGTPKSDPFESSTEVENPPASASNGSQEESSPSEKKLGCVNQ